MHMYFNVNRILSHNSQIRNVLNIRGLNDGRVRLKLVAQK